MTLNALGCLKSTSSASRAISAVAELLVSILAIVGVCEKVPGGDSTSRRRGQHAPHLIRCRPGLMPWETSVPRLSNIYPFTDCLDPHHNP